MRLGRALGIAAGCIPMLAVPTTGLAAAARTYVIPSTESTNPDGSWPALFRPAQLPFAQDGTLYVTNIRWKGWNGGRAVGHGTAHETSCNPSCAQGQTRLVGNAEVVANRRTDVDGVNVYEGLWVHAGSGAARRLNWAVTPSSVS
jgi:hypothetical protein